MLAQVEQVVASLPPRLAELLQWHAHAGVAVEELTAAQQELALREQQCLAAKPSLLTFLESAAARRSRETQLTEIRTERAALVKAVDTATKMTERIETSALRLVETWLLERSPEYASAVACRKLAAEWLQALEAFGFAIGHLVVGLGNARNTAAAGYNVSKGLVSVSGAEAFSSVLAAATAVEKKLAVMNAIAESHHQSRKTGGSLPRVEPLHYTDKVREISKLPPGPMQLECDRIKTYCEQLLGQKLAPTKQEFSALVAAKTDGQAQAAFQELRDYYRRTLNPAESEQILADAEDQFAY